MGGGSALPCRSRGQRHHEGACPGDAIPSVKDESKRLTVDFGGKAVWWGDVRMGRCTLSHHGMNNECSPFLKKEFPNMAFDVRHSEMTEEEAYILSYTMANGKWGRKPETVSDGVNPYREEFLDENYPGIRANEYKKTED